MPTLTVVVPALNEEQRLPELFSALERQTRRPDQVVIADAGSTDATRSIAEKRGATVVDGGKPAAGRNAGASAATGDLLLFLDADDEFDDEFISSALDEFAARALTVATSFVEPIERDTRNLFATDVVNLYLDVMQYVSPHAPGFCILVRRSAHEAIGGFDETVVLAEDHDYVQRAAEQGKFRVLRSASVGTSMRRIEKEGLVRLAFMYLYCEMFVVAGIPIREVPFDYEFAAFEPRERTEFKQAIDTLRTRLGEVADTVVDLPGDSLDALRKLGSVEITDAAFDTHLGLLGERDLKRLQRYVGARLRLARRTPRRAVASIRRAGDAIWSSLKQMPADLWRP
jgi:glycosyltransferase involved in cell wall biosynthesis